MCGFLASLAPGVVVRSGSVAEALAQRGPDARSVHTVGHATFVHTRLEILGLGANGKQPAMSTDGRRVLVYNGEIYNFRALAHDYDIEPAVSDTDVLFALLQTHDPVSIVSQLRGMFAFAYYDADDDTLTAARDPFGIKPLYVHSNALGQPTLVSCLPALLAAPLTPDIDASGLLEYVAFGHTGFEHTIYAQVAKLVPGEVYQWRFDQDGHGRLRRRSIAWTHEATRSLKSALQDSVRAHLVADVEVGAFLSGGIDSTLLCALAVQELGSMRTFTVGFPESPERNESGVAEHNAQLIGTEHATVPATSQEMWKAAASFLAQHGEPFGDAACLPLTVLARHAGDAVKVVLCGEGGDEVFGGYGRYRISRRLRAYEGPCAPLAQVWGKRRSDKPWARASEAVLWGGGYRAHAALLGGELPLLDQVAPALTCRYVARAHEDWQSMLGDDNLATARRYDLARWLPNVYLEKTDRATMASGLEARVPYLDLPLAAVASRLIVNDTSKRPLRDFVSELLPNVRLPDRKKGLAVDIPRLRTAGFEDPFRYAVEHTSSVLHRAFGANAARSLQSRAERSPSLFFRLATLGLWEQIFDAERMQVTE